MLGVIGATFGAVASVVQAGQNAKAAGKAMRAQAAVDTASRRATANSMIAAVHSQNAKVKELQRMDEMMTMQAKADSLIRKESYNDTAAMQLVMGAASGRATNEGSVSAIMNKSHSDFMWDNMWAENIKEISQAALYQDMENIYQAGSNSLLLGGEQLGVARLGSQAGQANTAAAAQQAFNNTIMSGVKSTASAYGGSIMNLFQKG